MRYLGGKNQLGKEISGILKKYAPPEKYSKYIEPFCGSLGVTIHMVDDYKVYVSDYQKDLILLWKAIKSGTFKYPRSVSKQTYYRYKNDPKPSAMRAFVGFGCSFGGKWFGGYAEDYNKKNYTICSETVRSIKRLESSIKKIKSIKHCSYDKWHLKNCLIYCEPPYRNTTGYDGIDSFDHEKFWDTIRKWSKRNIVIVSEYTAPKDFKCIWKKQRAQSLAPNNNKTKTEKLFMLPKRK